jgi:AcrR family transcriptional regulator
MGVAVVDRDQLCPPAAPDSRSRILDAALGCVSRFGLTKTTVDDVARSAGLSRATLYRLFPGGREEIVGGMVEREVRRFFRNVESAMTGRDDLEDRLVIAMTSAAMQLAEHPVLGFLLAHEPEAVLPLVSFSSLDRVLDAASAFLAPYLAGDLEVEDARRVGEWVARLVLSHMACPPGAAEAAAWPSPVSNSFRGAVGTPFALHPEPLEEDRARSLVRHFVLPGMRELRRASSASPAAGSTTSSKVQIRPTEVADRASVTTR